MFLIRNLKTVQTEYGNRSVTSLTEIKMRKFIDLARYIRTWWQWRGQSKKDRRFRFVVYFGMDPYTGKWKV